MAKAKLSFNRRMLSCYNAIKICIKEKHLYQVSALTLSTLLAIVPAIIVSIYISKLLPMFDGVIAGLKSYAFANYIPGGAESVHEYILQFASHATSLPVGGIVFLFVTVAMLMILIKNTMNDIWHSPRHSSWRSITISWVVLLCLPLLVGISIFSSHYFLSLYWVGYAVDHLGIAFALTTMLPILINVIGFSMLYYFAPNCHVYFTDVLFGALTAAVLFEIAKYIFEFYLRHFATEDIIYGSLAIIPTFIFWIYISWTIIVYGAIVTYAENQQRII